MHFNYEGHSNQTLNKKTVITILRTLPFLNIIITVDMYRYLAQNLLIFMSVR